jgi:hypothetical protein
VINARTGGSQHMFGLRAHVASGAILIAMNDTDQRHLARSPLQLTADLRVSGADGDYRVRVRNLSSGGLMAEGGPRVSLGMTVWVQLGQIGRVAGAVAWVQDNRFGVAFDAPLDAPFDANVVRLPKGATPADTATSRFGPADMMAKLMAAHHVASEA